mgnify:CR=1 FL=1
MPKCRIKRSSRIPRSEFTCSSAPDIAARRDENGVPFLSVIAPVYNDNTRLANLLESLGRQTYPVDLFEIIVVDNASQDGVADAVESYPVRLIRNAENLGFSAANNVGFEASAGRYLLFSNPDIEVTAETLPALRFRASKYARPSPCRTHLRPRYY